MRINEIFMKLFIDSANIEEIKQASSRGILDGCTTNPTLAAKNGVKDFLPLAQTKPLTPPRRPAPWESAAKDWEGRKKGGRGPRKRGKSHGGGFQVFFPGGAGSL